MLKHFLANNIRIFFCNLYRLSLLLLFCSFVLSLGLPVLPVNGLLSPHTLRCVIHAGVCVCVAISLLIQMLQDETRFLLGFTLMWVNVQPCYINRVETPSVHHHGDVKVNLNGILREMWDLLFNSSWKWKHTTIIPSYCDTMCTCVRAYEMHVSLCLGWGEGCTGYISIDHIKCKYTYTWALHMDTYIHGQNVGLLKTQ